VWTVLLALLHSNWASVGTTQAWTAALTAEQALPGSDLGTSAATGTARAGQR
jgi:hypothetical protein